MSEQEKIVSSLFEEARNEKIETNLYDIQNCLGTQTFKITLDSLFDKIKNLTNKTIIMFATAFLTIGIVLGTFLFQDTKSIEMPISKDIIKQDETRPESLISEVPLRLVETLNHSVLSEKIIEHQPLEIEAELPKISNQKAFIIPQISEVEFTDSVLPTDISASENIQTNTPQNEYNYGTFDAIKISSAITAVITQGEKESVSIVGESSSKLKIVVRNVLGTLEIFTEEINADNKKKKNNNGYQKGSINQVVYITVKNLKQLNCSGATKVSGNGSLVLNDFKIITSGASTLDLDMRLNQLDLSTSGASIVNFKLELDQLRITTSGASDIQLNGRANALELNSSGASEIKALNFEVAKAKINASGASDITLIVREQIEISVSGASKLYYKGNPTIITEKSSGASKIQKLD
jgi:hypothetical protein